MKHICKHCHEAEALHNWGRGSRTQKEGNCPNGPEDEWSSQLFEPEEAVTSGPWRWAGDSLESKDERLVLGVRDLPERAYPELQSGSLVMENEASDKSLIAAAPDLLEAIKKVMATCGPHDGWNGETREFLIACENALAKATGRVQE